MYSNNTNTHASCRRRLRRHRLAISTSILIAKYVLSDENHSPRVRSAMIFNLNMNHNTQETAI